jgi:hypothetical protein
VPLSFGGGIEPFCHRVVAGAGRPKGRLNSTTIQANEAARLLPRSDDPMAWLLALMADDW